MDAAAYLMRHGWSGPGNPLNKNTRPGAHGGLGLTRPILVARKQNNHGVGKKVTKDSATNQWWLRGFEDALKGVGEEAPAAPSSGNALTSELYRFFVRGECLKGTLDVKKEEEEKKEKEKSSGSSAKSKRKREDDGDDERDARKKAKAARKEEKRLKKEGKEERRMKRKEKREKKERKKLKLRSVEEQDYPTPVSTEEDMDVDSSEGLDRKKEKKEKKEKREKKEKKSRKDKDGDDETADSKKSKSKKEKKDKKSKTA